jgi:beta-glucosidase
MPHDTRFPDGFLWGAATSAYQIEGSPLAEGASVSNWHRFTHTPGRTDAGDTGDVACDHYRLWREDVALMKQLGLGAYRFSLAWSRILPDVTGKPNRAGLAFYDRLIDALLEAGIRPCVTLHHWDLPAAFDDRGGWLNPEAPGWFADYARVCFDAFDDRVPMWATLNEPWVIVDAGYLHGVHAPGHRSAFEAVRAAHGLLLGHAEAVRAYRERGRHAIGLVVNLEPKEAASDAPADLAAAARSDAQMNHHYLDAVLLGRYPEALAEVYGEAWKDFHPAEMTAIREPIDWLGINYYKRGVMRHDGAAWPTYASPVRIEGSRYTDLDWEVHAPSLERALRDVKARYGDLPLYVTENGAAFPDPPAARGGRVDDPLRVEYLRDHLCSARAAIDAGIDLRGYFAWSLLDNFEWSAGYARRFGLVHVDYATQARTPKASAAFYREVIRTHGASLAGALAR